MAYADEELIRTMNSYKKEYYGDLETGIYIKEELYEFERQLLFDDRMAVMLPKTFADMPIPMAKIKYPMEQRPPVIKTNESGDINFTFNLLDMDAKDSNIQEIRDDIKQMLKAAQPANVFYEQQMEAVGPLTVSWFDYKSHGLDQKIYNLMYYFSLNGKLFHGVFNCVLKDVEIWKPIVLQVIYSITDLTRKEEGR